ncbi:ABC transporter permease subunit [Chryseobacterium sp. RP-3-3]|uniref:ABC transporter permease subunit n=1 Tax=Chryseobacterium antibioticum TaxID=2728847 RepID=A0A7Y0AS06_9FLAO|nr:ABC transporter permease [Chryseobacterium antibioticum]NML72426.1 ABC transporter permease subunit [Chryseobacterium antibioticum]
MTNTFYKAFSSEQYKLSKSKELFGILLLPALIIIAIDFYNIYNILTEGGVGVGEGTFNPWKFILGRTVCMFLYMLYPILVSLFVHACCDVEYRNNNYKILFTLPVSKSKIFFSKVAFMLITVWFSILLTYFVFLLSGYLFSIIFPELGFQNYDFREVIFYIFLKFSITLSAITMVQLTLSLMFKNFIYPIGFSMFMLIFSGFANEKKFSDFLVYTGGYRFLENLLVENISFGRLDYCNMAAIFVFAGVSFYLFVRKKAV